MKKIIYIILAIIIAIPIIIGRAMYSHYNKIRQENIEIQMDYTYLWDTIPNDELSRFKYTDYSQVNEVDLFLAISAYNSYNDKDLTLEDFKEFLAEEYNDDGSLRIENVPKKIQDYGDWYNETGKTTKVPEYKGKLIDTYISFELLIDNTDIDFYSLTKSQFAEVIKKEADPSYEINKSLWNVGDNISSDIDSGDEEINASIKENVKLGDDRLIESYVWADFSEECFRVAIKSTENSKDEYSHVEDYFFVKKDGVICLNVEYPSKQSDESADRYVYDACDFNVKYMDVTFDGEKDIQIYLGEKGPTGSDIYCSYVYKDNEFVYTKSFEEIRNYVVNKKGKFIYGEYDGEYPMYKYEDGVFKEQ